MNLSKDTRTALSPTRSQPPPASRASSELQQRAGRVLVRAWPRARYELMRVGPVGLAGSGLMLAAALAGLVLLLPGHRSLMELRTELTRAGHSRLAADPGDKSPQQFAAALPAREQIPALLGLVLMQATDAGIVLPQGRYTFSPATSNRLSRYSFEFPVKADYGKIRKFIDKSLLAIPALGLDKLHVERKNVGDTEVNADVGFVIYMRGG